MPQTQKMASYYMTFRSLLTAQTLYLKEIAALCVQGKDNPKVSGCTSFWADLKVQLATEQITNSGDCTRAAGPGLLKL